MPVTDKDRPSTWMVFRSGLCGDCAASCCHMPVEVRLADLVRLGLVQEGELSPKKIARRLQKAGIVRSYRVATGLFLLEQTPQGACPFLENLRCTVYENRPDTCRGFPRELGPRVGYCPYRKAPIKESVRGF